MESIEIFKITSHRPSEATLFNFTIMDWYAYFTISIKGVTLDEMVVIFNNCGYKVYHVQSDLCCTLICCLLVSGSKLTRVPDKITGSS